MRTIALLLTLALGGCGPGGGGDAGGGGGERAEGGAALADGGGGPGTFDAGGALAGPQVQGEQGCGNGVRDPGEACDGSDFGGVDCAEFGFSGGSLRCSADCQSVRTGACREICIPACGARMCGPDPVCGALCGVCLSGVCGPGGQCVGG